MEAKKRILIINGVNLQELGTREVNIYGTLSFDEYFKALQQRHPEVEPSFHRGPVAEADRVLRQVLRDEEDRIPRLQAGCV